MRLAHGWTLEAAPRSGSLTREFIRPPVRAVPPAMAQRIGPCRVALVPDLPGAASAWRDNGSRCEIEIAAAGIEGHEIAMELLLCLGQVLWERLREPEWEEWWGLLAAEMRQGAAGEIDEQALQEKRRLLANRASARSPARLGNWAAAAFAGTVAEYVHAMWHDVTVRGGPQHLPAPQLRRRLEWLAHWFPPGRGYRVFPA